MFVKLHRINRSGNRYYLSEVSVNVSHVTYLSENRDYRIALSEGKLDIGLNENVEFTDIVLLKGGKRDTITVIGGVEIIEHKINSSTKKLLRD